MAANDDDAIIARVCKDHNLVEADAKTWFYGDESIGQPVGSHLLELALPLLHCSPAHLDFCGRGACYRSPWHTRTITAGIPRYLER